MRRYTACTAGLAGIALFLSIIVVVSEDVPSTGSPSFNTTQLHNGTTEPMPTPGTTQRANNKTPIVQLSETDQQLEELLLTTQNHSMNVEDEGSGQEPYPTHIQSADEFTTTNPSIAQSSDMIHQTTTQAMAEATESQRTTTVPVTTVIYKAAQNSSENASTIDDASAHSGPMPESTTTVAVHQPSESLPTTVATVTAEQVTETTNVSMATTENQTMRPTGILEVATAGAITTPLPQSNTESSSTPQPEATTYVSPSSLPTIIEPIHINRTSQGRSMNFSFNTEFRLENETTEDTSSTAVLLTPLEVTIKEETAEYSTYASSIVEHYVTTEGKILTTTPEPTTLTYQPSTQPPLIIGATNVSQTTGQFETEVTNTTESVTESSSVSVTIPVTETTRTVKMSTGTPSSVTTVSNIMEQNETTPELSTDAPSAGTDFAATLSTEISTEMSTPPQSKCYDQLSEPEFFNSVTIVFSRPSRMRGMLFDRETFKENVICLMNTYELQGWPLTVLNTSDCNEVNSTLDSKLLAVTDLVIIEPSPTLNNNEIILSFFIRNTTAKYSGQIVSRNRTLTVLNNHKDYLMNQMGINISDIYAGMRLSHLISPNTIDPFYMRHSLLLIILAVVAGVCILIIISGLIYIKCRNTKSKWSSTSSYTQEKSKLQGDMLCSEMGQHLNSDDDINKDETLRAMNNGNGFFTADTGSGSSATPIGDEDGWVIPYDELSPEEKSTVDVEDTKL